MTRLIAGNAGAVKSEVFDALVDIIKSGRDLVENGGSAMEMERFVGRSVGVLARMLVAYLFACACRRAMAADMAERDLSSAIVRLVGGEDAYSSVSTTFGPVTFPNFSYRDLSSLLGAVVRHPGRKIFPYHRECRSTPLCLEWEARLGQQAPFRKAEELFRFFTRGASTVEDTTIGRHMLLLSKIVEPDWLYSSPTKIREVLLEKATRDKETKRPILYVSTDAHALRRYAGAGWETEWKMINAIRVWCEDAATGQIIHLGGEFLWDDCHGVRARFCELMTAGIMPNGDPDWAVVRTQVVFISDGSDWIATHILPVLPTDTVAILDPYHLLEWVGEYGRAVLGIGSPELKKLLEDAREALFGKQRPRKAQSKARKGHKKRRRRRRSRAYNRPWLQPGRPRTNQGTQAIQALLWLLLEVKPRTHEQAELGLKLIARLNKNVARTDYPSYLARSFQIGSGAMESMHSFGSQRRMKLPGAKWLEETSLAVLTFRMLEIGGRWDEFWSQANIAEQIADGFTNAPPKHPTLEAA